VFRISDENRRCDLQNLDSGWRFSLTDVSHYFDSDPTKLIAACVTTARATTSYIA